MLFLACAAEGVISYLGAESLPLVAMKNNVPQLAFRLRKLLHIMDKENSCRAFATWLFIVCSATFNAIAIGHPIVIIIVCYIMKFI